MPYTIKKVNGKYKIIRKADGKVVGTSKTLANARGTIWHRTQGDKK